MLSLFNASACSTLVARVQALEPKNQARWGKMNVAQMLAHCQRPFLVASGELPLRRMWLGRLFGRLAKKAAIGGRPMAKNLPTDPSFIIPDPGAFEVARAALIAAIEDFQRGGPAAITDAPHPFFGPMTASEWDTLLAKHLDHHLRQFGV